MLHPDPVTLLYHFKSSAMKLFLKTPHRIIVLLISCLAILNHVQSQTLPGSWQPGMALTTYYGGGIRDQRDSLRITDGASFERHTGMDNNKKYAFHFSGQELNDLLTFLKEKHFDKIKTGPPMIVEDGWSSDITLQWNNGFISIDTGAGYKVPEAYRKDLSDIIQYISNMVDQKKKHRK
jgi:hypothetical protein